MKRGKHAWSIYVGIFLCLVTLAFSVLLQKEGYLTYLDSDMASELLLARRQVDTHSLVQMDWLYSTEVRIVQINLLYALAFLFTPSFFLARVVGNTIGLILCMGMCAYLCRRTGISWGRTLCTCALLPVTSSAVYASAVTVGGYYIVHIGLGFAGAGLWISAGKRDGRRSKKACACFAAMALLLGFLSVRYVLCFVCPMVAVTLLDVLLAKQPCGRQDERVRFACVTLVGFATCLLGFVASEVILPRLFVSGVGSASSFTFNPLDGAAVCQMLFTVFADFLKLLGWRGGVALFSLPGVVNLCVAGTVFLGMAMVVRTYRALDVGEETQLAQKRMIRLAAAAFFVNLFCFVWIEGTYLNRYLILAVILFVPVVPILVQRERNGWLRGAFLVLLCVQLGLSGVVLLTDTRSQEKAAQARSADMMDAAAYLLEEGYTHGYGTFWNVRVMQERTQGALTCTGVVPVETEEGAVAESSLDFIRWLEPDSASDLDACAQKTFLLLTREEEEQLGSWLAYAKAPVVYENDGYVVYGYDNSEQLIGSMLWGKMKLEGAAVEEDAFVLEAGGRMRVPTTWREEGNYVLTLTCDGEPASDSVVQLYTGRNFELLAEQAITSGENEVRFSLEEDDKYFMILIKSGSADALTVRDLNLHKQPL